MKNIRATFRRAATVTIACLLATPAFADKAGDAMAEKMMAAFGDREIWASRKVDHITAVVAPPQGEAFLIDIWNRWDKPQTVTWVRARTREQVRIFDGDRGWSATRQRGGGPAEVKEWDATRVAAERSNYETGLERLIHRIAQRDPLLSFSVLKDGPYEGWLKVEANGQIVDYVLLREDGSPEKVLVGGNPDNPPLELGPLVSFGDHNQPSNGVAGGAFTTYVAELMHSAEGVNFGYPTNLNSLSPTQ